MGYCFGGTAVLEFARSGADLKGFATFHGGLSLPEGQDYAATRGKVLILHGTADRNIGMDQFAALAGDLEDARTPMKSRGSASADSLRRCWATEASLCAPCPADAD
jgi:dienelactone hydrolase